MPEYMQAISRVLIASVFIVFGYIQATHIGNYIANPAVVKVAGMTSGILTPTIIAYVVMLINLVGGILILVGYQTRWTSIVLIAFVVLTLIFVHNFWTMEGPARDRQSSELLQEPRHHRRAAFAHTSTARGVARWSTASPKSDGREARVARFDASRAVLVDRNNHNWGRPSLCRIDHHIHCFLAPMASPPE